MTVAAWLVACASLAAIGHRGHRDGAGTLEKSSKRSEPHGRPPTTTVGSYATSRAMGGDSLPNRAHCPT